MVSYSEFKSRESVGVAGYKEAISSDYRVFVNGEEIPVYTCRISAYPFNRAWPGHQRSIEQTNVSSFVNIVSDEDVKIEVVINRPYEKVMLKPYSKNIGYHQNANRVSFELTNEAQLLLACDNMLSCLYIFNSKPIECPKPEDVTYFFGPGVYNVGKIVLKDNESVYVDKDALVFGCVFAEGAKNVRVFGNGMLDDSGEERVSVHFYEKWTNGNIKFYQCENVRIEGVMFRNSAVWCVNIFNCFDAVIDNVKVFGQWRYNTDGVDIVNSRNIIVKNSLIHSFDDTIAIKGIDAYIKTDNEGITVENCVLWCDWGKACELGFETACREYKNIIFRNCDVLRCGAVAIDIHNGDCAEISNVIFEDIRVEYNSFDMKPAVQISDEHQYDKFGEHMVPRLICIANDRFRSDEYCNDVWNIPKEMAEIDLTGIQVASVHDISIKDIMVYYDEAIPKKDGCYHVPMSMVSYLEGVEYYGIRLSGIKVNGEKIGIQNAVTDFRGVKDIAFE